MSQDEIRFEDVRYREPVRLRRPDRDRRWACLAYEVPASDDLPVFLDHETADAIERHALRDTSVELGGILLGKECVDDESGAPFVWVTRSLEAKHYENTQASFTYTHDSWEEITRERDQKHPDLDIVGWYHTHPDFGVFLSSHDLFIQHHFFGQPLQLAYVVDPVRQTRGFFRWRDGEMVQVAGFTLTAYRGDRAALARLVNDLENVPNAAGGGAGLSPRLEAELINMLTRPATQFHAPTAADRTQTALLFGLLGSMLGVLGLSAVLWLNALHGSVQEQTRALDDLRKSVAETADNQRVALDAAVGDPGGGAGVGKELRERYNRSLRERDEARRQLANQATTNDLLAARVKQIDEDRIALQKKYAEAKSFEKDAKIADEFRTRFEALRVQNENRSRTIEELEEILDTVEGRKAASLHAKYRNTWYVAVAGWAASAALALVLIGGIVYLKYPNLADETADPEPENPNTHRIS